MRVLLVNTSESAGGAAIAAQRLLRALRQNGVEASLLCRDTATKPGEGVARLQSSALNKVKFALERGEIFLANGLTRKGLFSVDTARYGADITRTEEFREADVVHLHWVNQAMLSLSGIERILRSGKRVVWTMHDMWPFTGVCHQAGDCDAWKRGCGDCPQLRRPGKNDFSARVFARKREAYKAGGRIAFVGCSQWLAALAAEAPLCAGHTVESIPNPIDTAFYTPVESKAEARRVLGLPQDKRILLFVAFKATDPNKGISYLAAATDFLRKKEPEAAARLSVAIAGKEADEAAKSFSVPAYPLGYVTETERMRLVYQAADVLVMPTLMDNLPNTIVEAMACGVPCVGFEVGGLPQMIDPGVNGYLAKYKDSEDLARGIALTLGSASYASLCRNARAKAVQSYSEKAVAARYIKLYGEKED